MWLPCMKNDIIVIIIIIIININKVVGSGSGSTCIYVVVNFLSQVIFLFLLFLGMVMYANGVETKEK